MRFLNSKLFLFCLCRSLLILTVFSSVAQGANWKYLYCYNAENSESIELDLVVDQVSQKASLKTKESVYLLLQIPCQGVSNEGPYLKCSESFGNDSRQLYSFSRIENGFIDGYSAELIDEKVFYIVLERFFQDGQGQYQQLKREFKFKSKDCLWE